MIDHLSASQLTLFQRCAEHWRRRHIENERLPLTIPAHVGRAVRETVLLSLRHRMDTGLPMTPEHLRDVAVDAYARSLKNGVYVAPEELSSARAALADGRNSVATLAELFRRELSPRLRPADVDRRVLLDLGLPLPVLVTLDCITPEGDLQQVATASRRWSADRLNGSPAHALRREALRRHGGTPAARLFVNVLVDSKTPALQILEAPHSPEELAVVLRRFRLMLSSVAAGIFPPAAPESWICTPRWCGYFYSCPHVPGYRKALPVAVHGAVAAHAAAFAV